MEKRFSPRPNPDWRRVRKGSFENVQVDDSGTTTIWRKSIGASGPTNTRRDELPNGLYRETVGDGEEGSRFEVGSKRSEKATTFLMYPDSLRLVITIPTRESPKLTAIYEPGQLSVDVGHVSKRERTYEQIEHAEFGKNLEELAEWEKRLGSEAFSPNARLSEAKTKERIKAKDWTEREMVKARILAGNVVQEYAVFVLDEVSNEFVTALTNLVVADLPDAFRAMKLKQRHEAIEKCMVSAVAKLTHGNIEKLEEKGDYGLFFTFREDEVEVEISDADESIEQRCNDRAKKFRFEEYSYEVEEENGRIVFRISDKLGKKPAVVLALPKEVDLDMFKDLVSTPDTSGWEKALALVDIHYSSNMV